MTPCAESPDLFYPDVEYLANARLQELAYQPARKLCAQCPLTAECLDLALSRSEQWGVWGGMSPSQRRRLKIRVRRVA